MTLPTQKLTTIEAMARAAAQTAVRSRVPFPAVSPEASAYRDAYAAAVLAEVGDANSEAAAQVAATPDLEIQAPANDHITDGYSDPEGQEPKPPKKGGVFGRRGKKGSA